MLTRLIVLLNLTEVKRLIGHRFSDKSVQEDVKLWPFEVVGSSDDRSEIMAHYQDEKRLFKPEQISCKVLANMKETTEIYLG
jgi:L1 cell adhesion molecule like protein